MREEMARCADGVCRVIAHGGPRYTLDRTGWGDFLARWIWLRNQLEGK